MTRRRRQPVDWVVNEETYGESAITISPGAASATFFPLTYSWQNMIGQSTGGTTVLRQAWPEQDEQQTVLAVRGHYSYTPNTWAVGNQLFLACRIDVFPQEQGTDQAIIDPNQSLFVADYANTRFVWQNMDYQAFSTANDATSFNRRVSVSFNRRLEKNEALYFVCETGVGSVATRVRMQLRTLMRVPGR